MLNKVRALLVDHTELRNNYPLGKATMGWPAMKVLLGILSSNSSVQC
jgi:hypothetical protein